MHGDHRYVCGNLLAQWSDGCNTVLSLWDTEMNDCWSIICLRLHGAAWPCGKYKQLRHKVNARRPSSEVLQWFLIRCWHSKSHAVYYVSNIRIPCWHRLVIPTPKAPVSQTYIMGGKGRKKTMSWLESHGWSQLLYLLYIIGKCLKQSSVLRKFPTDQ